MVNSIHRFFGTLTVQHLIAGFEQQARDAKSLSDKFTARISDNNELITKLINENAVLAADRGRVEYFAKKLNDLISVGAN